MSERPLGIAALMEGGLDMLRRHPVSTAIFIAANAFAGYATVWLMGDSDSLALGFLLGFAVASPVSSLFVLALGDNLRGMAADQIELVIRLVFALAASLLAFLGTAIAAIAFIIPGLYVGARWTVAPPLVLLNGRGIIASMSESWRLTEAAAWPLVGVSVILAIPTVALSIWGLSDPSVISVELSAKMILQNLISAAFTAFSIAVCVFAYRELASPGDELSEVFA